MLVEIPGYDVILSVIAAFLAGLGGLWGYYRLRPAPGQGDDPAQKERLEYYERQLIDMKIRLDALEVQDVASKPEESAPEIRQLLERLLADRPPAAPGAPAVPEDPPKPVQKPASAPAPAPRAAGAGYSNPSDHVLHLITDGAMTSRDIQVTLKKSREHTSRLMKKLFEDGYVRRNTDSRPYTYSITEKGMARIGGLQVSPRTA